jgi:GTP pyrophosphokinase
VSASGEYDAKIAVLRRLKQERDLSGPASERARSKSGLFEDRIYVLTPDAAVGGTSTRRSDCGLCLRAHKLGTPLAPAWMAIMVPLNTLTAERADCRGDHREEGGPSRDWLNPELHFWQRSRQIKVRAWFNALACSAQRP